MIKSTGILLVNTDRSDFAKQFDSDEVKFKKLLIPYRPDWKLNIIPVIDNIFPDAIDANDAYIITGSPASVNDSHSWIPKLYEFIRELNTHKYPTIGICFGHQILSKLNGGKVKQSKHREFGLANIYKKNESLLTKNFFNNNNTSDVWMSHADQVSKMPKNFKIIASTKNSKLTIIENIKENFYGVQFHPEVTHTNKGKILLRNFVFLICKIKKNKSIP